MEEIIAARPVAPLVDREIRFLDAAVADDRRTWIDLWSRWPDREVMAHPDYVRLFARPQDRVVAAARQTANGGILYPFIVRPLAQEPWCPSGVKAWDTTTAYGYGGAFAWNTTPEEAVDFWPRLERWALQEHVVTSFARLSLFPDHLLPFDGEIEMNGPNVVRSLTGTEEEIWGSYDSKVRQNIRRARSRGCRILIDPEGQRLDEFLAVYTATMERRNAFKSYFFARDFFEALLRDLAGHCIFFHIELSGKVVSTELVLLSEKNAYFFLGGTLEEAFDNRPNELLQHETFLWCRGAGRKAIVLGGAYRASEGLLRYKKAFAPTGVVPFTVGRKIYDPDLVATLTDHRRAGEAGWKPEPGFFPPYRA